MEETATTVPSPVIASGEKTKARDIIAAITILQRIEHEHRPATAGERQVLARFGGFGDQDKPGAELRGRPRVR